MENKNSEIFFLFITVFTILFFMFFFNYLSALYTDVDLFKLDLNNKEKKFKKLIFILKNNYLLFVVICFLQVIMSFFFSESALALLDTIYPENNHRILWLFVIAIFVALLTEILVRYLVTKKKYLVLNNFFLTIAFFIVLITNPILKKIIKPKKKIIANSEQEVIRFVQNLTMDNIVEKREAQLVQAAFNFDDLRINEVLVPRKKTICLTEKMSLKEIQQINVKYSFTCYPVLNKNKEICGVFNFKLFYQALVKKNDLLWQELINKKPICFTPNDTLDQALEKFQKSNSSLAIIKENKLFVGIITDQDIFDTLIGKNKITPKFKN